MGQRSAEITSFLWDVWFLGYRLLCEAEGREMKVSGSQSLGVCPRANLRCPGQVGCESWQSAAKGLGPVRAMENPQARAKGWQRLAGKKDLAAGTL